MVKTDAQKIPNRRAIIDRKQLSARLAGLAEDYPPDSMDLRRAVLQALKEALAAGRAEIRRRLEDDGVGGGVTMAAGSYLIDQIIRVLYDFTTGFIFRATNPTASERLSLVAVGGYGRGEMAPFSDVDLLFLLPYKQTPWSEQVVEYLLYLLWDLNLKVGHAVRSVDDCIRRARDDLTISTALLEARYLWGDQPLFLELKQRYRDDVVNGKEAAFIAAKLAERDARHIKVGDSRYVLEPNVKEGKGGLRDLHTLFWIANYAYHADTVAQLIEEGVLTAAESRRFKKAREFLSTVRCHLHYLAGRAEERLTFDQQPELTRRLNYTDHAGASGVERFMKHYYLVAKDVGDLTRIFCAAIEAQNKAPQRFKMPRFGLWQKNIDGFRVDGGRIALRNDGDLNSDPINVIRLFHAAHEHDLDVHPNALRQITRKLKLINGKLRRDPEANRLFVELLCHRRDPETALRRLNEAGVMGRFVPDFGRVVAQMQHDMYHVYTVDEHTIRAIGVLAKIENGQYREDHPMAAAIIDKVKLRRALYVAVLLHDIAKGRGGDHSILGAEVAEELCPRFGLTDAETETVAWLVRHHLVMSNMAFKRDLDDPKTIEDFVNIVQSPERLRLLLILTVADIRAVGPGVWNGWKGQLLRDLFHRAEARMLGGDTAIDRQGRAEALQAALRARLSDWPAEDIERHLARGNTSFWLGADEDTHEHWARLTRTADQAGEILAVDAQVREFQSVTEVTVYAPDHPGLFTRLAGAMTLSGANIADARITTTKDGMALDVFWLQDLDGAAFAEPAQLQRMREMVRGVLRGEIRVRDALARRQSRLPARAAVFKVAPLVLIDNDASHTHTVIEVNGRDRPALLHDLTRALFDLSLSISNARISTYGERAVDVFYVKDTFGMKVTNATKLSQIEVRLKRAISGSCTPSQPPAAARDVTGGHDQVVKSSAAP